ncbi:MAG: hypothetical protein IK024_10915 [Treponema sp.]|nr:hypothetical protein [Treponema sp.]
MNSENKVLFEYVNTEAFHSEPTKYVGFVIFEDGTLYDISISSKKNDIDFNDKPKRFLNSDLYRTNKKFIFQSTEFAIQINNLLDKNKQEIKKTPKLLSNPSVYDGSEDFFIIRKKEIHGFNILFTIVSKTCYSNGYEEAFDDIYKELGIIQHIYLEIQKLIEQYNPNKENQKE